MSCAVYNKKKVKSLSDIALIDLKNFFLEFLQSSLKNELSPNAIRELKKYFNLNNSTSRVYQDLTMAICQSNISFQIFYLSLNILLNEGITDFGRGLYWDNTNDEIWMLMEQNLVALRKLNLENIWLRPDQLSYFKKIIESNQNLTHLTLPATSVCTREMLSVINKHCKKLRYIDLSDCLNFKNSAAFLSHCSFSNTLTTINLKPTKSVNSKVQYAGMAMILLNCPNVTTLSGFSYVSQTLQSCRTKNENFVCKLRHVRDTLSSKQDIETIVKSCPNLISLHLISPLNRALEGLQNVFLIELFVALFQSAELLDALKRIGSSLRSLILKEAKQKVNVDNIPTLCPFLEKLELNLITIGIVSEVSIHCGNLKSLTLSKCRIQPSQLKFLLNNLLKSLEIFRADRINLNDDDIKSIFGKKYFNNFKEFCVLKAQELTIESVYTLLNYCPNLQTVGSLNGWYVRHGEIEALSFLVRCENPSLKYDAKNGYEI